MLHIPCRNSLHGVNGNNFKVLDIITPIGHNCAAREIRCRYRIIIFIFQCIYERLNDAHHHGIMPESSCIAMLNRYGQNN